VGDVSTRSFPAPQPGRKCLTLLPTYQGGDEAKKAIRQSAEQKLEKLKPATAR